jgi:hypothetical protein
MPERRDHRSLPKTILTPAEAEARNLITHLLDAGFDLLDELHDDYIVIRDPGSGMTVFLTDARGGRLEFRCYLRGRRGETTSDGGSMMDFLEAAARTLQDELWCQFRVDRDRDVVIRHFYLRGGGVLLGNLLHAIRNFASLCDYARDRLLAMNALESDNDDAGTTPRETEDRDGPRDAGD